MPFASLRGYYDFIREQERVRSRAGSFPRTTRRNFPMCSGKRRVELC